MPSRLLESPRLLLMLDIESLDLGPRPVITQIALVPYDLEEDELLDKKSFVEYLPIQPQLDMATPRTISASTIVWWMQQSDEARARFENNLGDDMFDLQWVAKNFADSFRRITANGTIPYTLCAKGPQFDVVAVETLLGELGVDVPWDSNQEYEWVEDLRTLLRHHRINAHDVPVPEGFIKHVAYWDCRAQIDQYLACRIGKVIKEPEPDTTPAARLPDLDSQRKLPGINKPAK